MSDAYYLALHKCGERYRDMLLEDEELTGEKDDDHNDIWQFNMKFMHGCRDRMPIPKLCRWLGYIQAVLITRDLTTVEFERDFTRPLFRPLDYPEQNNG